MSRAVVLSYDETVQLLNQAESAYGPLIHDYLARSLSVVYDMFSSYPRIFAVRVDLRFAHDVVSDDVDSLLCMQRSDPAVITRFFESLKSQLREEHKRQNRNGTPALPAYMWCRERDLSPYPHYHLVLLFDKDQYAFLGDYTSPEANNMATRLQKAWCSALSLHYPDYAYLVHFPSNNVYWLSRQLAEARDSSYMEFLFRMAYLSKSRSKDTQDRQRNFGCSQQKGK